MCVMCVTSHGNMLLQWTATELPKHLCYHVTFLHHPADSAWVEYVVQRLMVKPLNYRCWSLGRYVRTGMLLDEALRHMQATLLWWYLHLCRCKQFELTEYS